MYISIEDLMAMAEKNRFKAAPDPEPQDRPPRDDQIDQIASWAKDWRDADHEHYDSAEKASWTPKSFGIADFAKRREAAVSIAVDLAKRMLKLGQTVSQTEFGEMVILFSSRCIHTYVLWSDTSLKSL